MFTDGPTPFKPRRESHSVVVTLIVVIAAALGLYAFSERMQTDRQRAALGAQQQSTANPRPMPVPPRPTRQALERHPPTERAYQAPAYQAPAAPPARVTIYLCKSYSGGMFWTTGTCSSQRATIDRIATVPGAMSFEDQVAMASREAHAAAALYASPGRATAGGIGATAQPIVQDSECPALAERIRMLDAMARLPQSGQVQDWIRSERMTVMSRRAALHC